MLHSVRGRTAFPQPSLCSSCCHFSLALSQGWLSKPLGQNPDIPPLVVPFPIAAGSAARLSLEPGKRAWTRPSAWAGPGKGSRAAELVWGRSPTCFSWLLLGFTCSNARVSHLKLRKITSEGVLSLQLPVGGVTP